MKKIKNIQNHSLKQVFKSLGTMKVLLAFIMIYTMQVATGMNLLYAQNDVITGIVKDSKGEPVIGVSIMAKGSSKGTVTDINGKFSLSVTSTIKSLVFSFIGMKKQEIVLAGKTSLNIVLEDDANLLDEVVAVGYGSQKRSDLTGSLVSINVKDMSKASVGNFTDMLSGRAAGVVVSSPDGQPGSLPNIVIRGANSITQSNSPLWVVDGFPLETADNSINPNDIESMEVLKDASATAIYGARGANGVIIITTKKGQIGAPVVSINAYYGDQRILKTMSLLSSTEYLQYQLDRDILSNNYTTIPGSSALSTITYTASEYFKYATLEDYSNQKSVDFQNLMWKPAGLQNYDMSISGGTDKTSYLISGNFFDQKGITIATGYSRYQGRIKLDQIVNAKLKIGVNAMSAQNKVYGNSPMPAQVSGYYSSTSAPFSGIWGYRPVTPLDANGNQVMNLESEFTDPSVVFDGADVAQRNLINPIINQKHTLNESIKNTLNVNVYAEYKLSKDLLLRVTGGINNSVNKNNRFFDEYTSQGNPKTGNGSINGVNGSIIVYDSKNWSNENILTYKKKFNNKHNLILTAVLSENGDSYSTYGASAIQLPNTSLGLNGLDEGTPKQVTSSFSESTMASVLGRVNYDYSNLYYFTFSHRLDASSKFSKENRWAGFSSGSVKWRATNEKWLKDKIDWLSDLSVRFSLGQTGNNRIDGYSTFSTITTGLTQAPFVNGNSIPISAIPSSIGNTNLKWETTTQSNLGVDLSFLKGRISFTADIYQKNTTDLLLNAQLPPFIGYGYAYKNIGSLRNQGLELTINTDNIRTKKFSWTSSFNISFNQSKVLALSENQETLLSVTRWDAQYFSSPSYASKIGQPLGQMYGLVWDGNYGYDDFYQSTALNPAAANVGRGSHWVLKDNVPTNGTARGAIQPGDIKFKDLNGDGIINQDDNTIIGRGTPIHTGGFGNNFTYNGFDLSLFFQWSYGNDIQNVNRMVFEGNVNNSSNFNQFSSYLDRWSSENTNSKNFRVGGQGPSGYYSSRTIEDGSYIRFKTLSFGYNISEQLLKKVKIKSVRVYVSGQNLFTWTKYAGMDPEVSTYNSVLTPGLDWSGYPKALSITGGVNLKF